MQTQRFVRAAALVITMLTAACASSPISKGLEQQVEKPVSLAQVRADPKSYQNTMVLWTGRILSTLPREKTTVIEILERPADNQKRPKNVDATQGRFIARYNGFLDPAVYSQGRDITVIGRITGTESALIGDYNYVYPVVAMEEHHLWPYKTETYYYRPSYYYPFYDPWWWYY